MVRVLANNFFIDYIPTFGSHNFADFEVRSGRVGVGFLSFMVDKCSTYINLLDVLKFFFVLSYGQSSMERGFSVNKEVEVENIATQTINNSGSENYL